MMSTVPSTPASAYGNGATGTPLRILNKGPKYFRNSSLRGSGSENRRKTAAERLEADKFKYVKSEEVRQRRFTLELRTSSPPNNDSTGAQSMGTASTGSPINMEEDDDITAGNDVIGDFTTEAIIQTMANFTKVKSQNATPVSSRRQQSRPSSENSNKKPVVQADNSAEILHSITAARRLQRLKNKALRSPEKEVPVTRSRKNDNVTPPSPLITRLRERLHSTNSGHSSTTVTGNAFTPSPSIATTAEDSVNSQSSEMKTTETESKSRDSNIKPVHGGKSSTSGNALNNYFTKAKEGIKNVASLRSIIGLDRDHSSDRSKERQSRSMTPSSGRRYRSASAGPNLLKSVQSNPRVSDPADHNKLSPSAGDAHPIMSPRTQLKHVRENLKKVKIGNDRVFPRKHTNSEASVPVEYMNGTRKVSGATFTVNPTASKRAENLKSPTEDALMANHEEAKVESKPPLMPRPKKEKENMQRTSSSESQPKYFEVLKKRSSSASSKEGNEDSSANSKRAEVRRSNSNRVKRRSWDILQSTENTTASKSSADEILLPSSGTAMETENSNSQSNGRPRRPRSYQHSEQKRNNQSSRMSLPEDAMQPFKDANSHLFQKTGSRKSVAEAIEEIIAPVLRNDDAVGNRNSAASPDVASMDEHTLVANRESFYGNWSVATTFGTGGGSITSKNTNNKSSGSMAENINFALTGAIDEQFGSVHSDSTEGNKSGSKPKSSSPYTRSKAKAARKLNEKEASSTELLDSSGRFAKSTTKPPSFFDSPTNSAHLRTVPMRQHSAPTGDSAKGEPPPQSNAGTDDGNLEEKSPRLAPKSRREVIPETRRTSSHNKAEDTLKSHTSSSGSADAAKPFTALTASDLKPRSNRNNRTIVPQSAPVKPTFAFPGQPVSQTRHNPKRHTTTPVSPTLSPNKQPARMTPPHTPTRSCSSTPYSSLKRTPTSSRSSSLKRNRHRGSKSDSPHHNELDRFFSTMGMGDYMTLTSQSCANETIYSNHWSSESDFSFAGASAYVRDSPDEAMDIDPVPPQLLRGPQSVSIIEKNARVMRWLMSCQKNRKNSAPPKPTPREGDTSATSQSPPVSPVAASTREPPLKPSHQLLSTYPPQASPAVKKRECPRVRSYSHPDTYPASPKPHAGYTSSPPPIPPRTYQRQRGMQPVLADDGVFAGPKESNV